MIRKAKECDIPRIMAIYREIFEKEKSGEYTTGWVEGVYPTEQTADEAVKKGEMYVLEEDGNVVAAAKINQEQMPQYSQVSWTISAADEQILVLHTLVVSPSIARKGCGRKFVAYYKKMAEESNCLALRIDTNERNLPARAMYRALGFTEAGIVSCVFNGIEGVRLVCLEQHVDGWQGAEGR